MENIENLKSIIAKNLTTYRKKAGITQQELADKLNYSDKSISKWERGEGVPDIYILTSSLAFKVFILYFMTENQVTAEKIVTEYTIAKKTEDLLKIGINTVNHNVDVGDVDVFTVG